MKTVMAVCLCLVSSSAAFAAPVMHTPPSAYQIIQKEGRLAFTDDSSYYDFEKNGKFYSGPLGLSGRTIEGTWELGQVNDFAGPLVVQGIWSWVNGISMTNDRRKMTLSIYPRFPQPKAAKSALLLLPSRPPRKAHFYSCYVVIDELIALPKPK